MGRLSGLTILLQTLFLGFFVSPLLSSQIEWLSTQKLSVADRNDIITLAKKMGIEDIKRVLQGQTEPVHCKFLSVESAVTETEHLRSWFELAIRRHDWRQCSDVPPESKRTQVGNWIAQSSDLRKRGEMKIEDDGWRLYLRF